jgi:propionyl-CoA synthetase
MLYGPLLRGCSTVIWEGDCHYPDAFVLWSIVESEKVTNLYVNVSMLREIKKEDYEGEGFKQSDCSSLKAVCLVGERADPDMINWIHKHLPDVIINDTYFCTELSWPMAG